MSACRVGRCQFQQRGRSVFGLGLSRSLVSISSTSFAGAGRRSDVCSQVDGDLGVVDQLLFLVLSSLVSRSLSVYQDHRSVSVLSRG